MQTSKFVFALGAAVAVILPLQVQAGPDNDEQAKMRETLRLKMEELKGPKAETPVAPTPKPEPAPVVAPPPVAPPPPAVVAPQAEVVPVPVPPPVAPVTVEVPEQPAVTTPPPAAGPEAALMREAVRQKIAELHGTPTPATTVVVTAPKSTDATPPVIAPVAAASATPIAAPPSPITGSKSARLADLLARYKSDTITALEYHNRRAAILAEP